MVPHRAARVAAIVLAAALALAAGAEPEPAEPEPAGPEVVEPAVAVIDRFHAALLDVMKNAEALGVDGRRARLEPVMDRTYDFPAMAKRSLGRAWGELEEAQRERFEQVFRAMILRTYASRFDGYTSERFETLGAEASIAGTEIVRTVLYAPKQEVHLDYRMRATPGGWRVIDIYLGGTVSELAMRRAEYTSVLERDGFDALVSALELKLADGPASVPASSDSRLK